MNNTELMPIETSLTERKRGGGLKPSDIIIRMLGLLFARAVLLPGMAPLGLSFLTIDRRISVKSIINLAFTVLGYILLFDFDAAVKYIPACVIFELVLFVMEHRTRVSLYFVAAAAGAVLFVCETAALVWTGFTGAEFVLVLCDVTIMIAGIVVFDRGGKLFERGGIFSRPLMTDEKISICVILGIILLGTRSLTILELFSAANLIACLMIAAASLSGGLTAGAVCGVCAGALMGLGGDFAASVAVYSICGLACGAAAEFAPKVRLSVSLALCTVGGVLTLYVGISSGALHTPNIYEFLAAAASAYFMPESVIRAAERITGSRRGDEDETARLRETVTDKLMRLSDSFYELSETFSEISDKQSNVDMSDVALLFDTAADRVCKSCTKVGFCWQRDFNSTYTTMFKFLEIMERKGVLGTSDIPPYFADKCVRLPSLVGEINRLFEVYKINRAWKSRLAENRELTGEQFKEISEIIKNTAEEIGDEKVFDVIASDQIADELGELGINADRADVMCDSERKYTVELNVVSCNEPENCTEKIQNVIKTVLGVNVTASCGDGCGKDCGGRCRMRFCQAECFETVVGTAGLSETGESGDRHYTKNLGNGKFVVTLSDGMGTGHKAAIESDAILRLLSNFLEAGFDKTIAVKLVNSVMVMKSAHDAFATVDMCVIDLYTGQAEFIKNGAEASYIKHPDYTETIRAASLPIGIVSIVDIETFAHTLESGAYVVMTSDGVTGSGDDVWLREMINSVDSEIDPNELAQIILDEAARRGRERGVNSDDMTVICVRVKDRRSTAARRIIKQKVAAL